MKTSITPQRVQIIRYLKEALEIILEPLWAERLGIDSAIKEYVEQVDNEFSRALREYVKALGMDKEPETGSPAVKYDVERGIEIRRVALLDLARRFNVPEVTAFVKAFNESMYFKKAGTWVLAVQLEQLRQRLAAIENGDTEARDLISVLGPLAIWYADPTVTEIIVDAPGRESVVRSGKANALTDIGPIFASQEELRQVIDSLMTLGGVTLGDENTIGEVRIPDTSPTLSFIPPKDGPVEFPDALPAQGARAVAVIPPTSVASPYLYIEKMDPDKFSFSWEKLLQWGVLSPEAHELLMTAIRYQGPGTNILVVGDRRNAKTYLLNLLAESLPAEERVIVLADSFQLPVARHGRRIHLEPRNATAQRLLELASRMRPDWLVICDLQGPEAMTLVQLMNTGYHALTTLCAQSPLEALTQIETMCLGANPSLGLMEIRPMIVAAFPLIIFMKSYALPDHRIKITQMVEVAGVENDRYVLQPLFTYDNELGVLHPTEAGKTWAARARDRIVTR